MPAEIAPKSAHFTLHLYNGQNKDTGEISTKNVSFSHLTPNVNADSLLEVVFALSNLYNDKNRFITDVTVTENYSLIPRD